MLVAAEYDRERRLRCWQRRGCLPLAVIVCALIGTLTAQCWILIRLTTPFQPLQTEASVIQPALVPAPYRDRPLQQPHPVSTSLPPLAFALWKAPAVSHCDAVFGNGFTRPITQCSDVICDQNPVTRATLCTIRNLVVDRTKITVSVGGEPIEAVLGRPESVEFPIYAPGALSVSSSCALGAVRDDRFPHHLAAMLQAFVADEARPPSSCPDTLTLFVTRYEYANLYHTMTDWYNAYQALAWAASTAPPAAQIVFADGHSRGALDAVWTTLFGAEPQFVATLPSRSCFGRAVLVPAGYTGALSTDAMDIAAPCMAVGLVREFALWVVSRLELGDVRPPRTPRLLVIVRRDYLAHPRVEGRPAARKIGNERELLDRMAAEFPQATLVAAAFENRTFAEQVREVRRASVVIGVHGAALSHVLLADPGSTTVVELMPPEYSGRHHFLRFAGYAGVRYERVPIGPESPGGFHHVPVDHLLQVLHAILSNS